MTWFPYFSLCCALPENTIKHSEGLVKDSVKKPKKDTGVNRHRYTASTIRDRPSVREKWASLANAKAWVKGELTPERSR